MFATKNHESSEGKTGKTSVQTGAKSETVERVPVNPLWQQLTTRDQSKITVSAPEDPYEREADRVADRVMRMATPPSRASALSISPDAYLKAQRKCDHCEDEENHELQRKEQSCNADSHATGPLMVHEALNSPGQPLDPLTRSFMEERFDHDFGQVRLHTDARASQSARAINAFAYTLGRDIVFEAGHYAPTTNEGRRLIAHELTHVVQQGSAAKPTENSTESDPSATLEHDAHTNTQPIADTSPAVGVRQASPLRIQRDGPPGDSDLVDTALADIAEGGVEVRVHGQPMGIIRGRGVTAHSVRVRARIVTRMVLEGPSERALQLSLEAPAGATLDLNRDTIRAAERDGYRITINLTTPAPASSPQRRPTRRPRPLEPEAPPPPLPAPRSLNASLDPNTLSGRELEDELARISDWLGRHPESSEERAHLESSWEALDRSHLARWGGVQAARQSSALHAAMARAAGFPAPQPEQHFINGFVGAAAFEVRPANWDALLQELVRGQAEFSLGATAGLLLGALAGLRDSIVALVELVWYLSPVGLTVTATQEAGALARDPEGHIQRREGQISEALRLLGALAALVGRALRDPGFVTEFSEELGELAGRSTGEWFNEDFMHRSTFEKGRSVGTVAGRVLIEALLLLLGPEEWLARGGAATGQAVRISAELERALVRLAEHVPELAQLLRLRQTRGLAEGAREATAAGRAVESITTASRRIIRGPDDMIRHYGGRLRSSGGALEEMWRRTGQAEIPVHRRAQAHEVHTVIRYLEQGAPDGRAIQRLDVIHSRSGSRTPDLVAHYVDGSVERIEITAVTSAPRGRLSTAPGTGIGARERLAQETLARSDVSAGRIADAIRSKVGPGSQLLAPLPGVPAGGTIVVHVTAGTVTPVMADDAIARVVNQLGPEVRRIEIAFMERAGASDPLRRTVRAYGRSPAGTYTLIP